MFVNCVKILFICGLLSLIISSCTKKIITHEIRLKISIFGCLMVILSLISYVFIKCCKKIYNNNNYIPINDDT